MFPNRFLVASLLLSATFTHASPTIVIDEAWEGFSSPDIISSGFTHNLYSLPLEGATNWKGPKNWSSDYWANREGGINLRWNAARKVGFNTTSPTLRELQGMSSRQLMTLAPSEKYDILMGRYDYPLKNEVARSVSPKADEWEGICHGWVVATIHHNEPSPKTLRNRDGIAVPFGSADIKALLSYYYAVDNGAAPSVGLRCNFGKWTGGKKECEQDLNAGAFHIILANKLALQGEALIMDVDRYKEVWNQPVIAYKTKVLRQGRPSRTAARSAVMEYRVATEVWYVEETDPTWNVVHGTESQAMAKKDLVYRLEVNAYNEIVGGTWESEERPDFIWHKPKAQSFGGMFSMLPSLLNDTTRENRDTSGRTYEDQYRGGGNDTDYRRPRNDNDGWDYSEYGNTRDRDPYYERPQRRRGEGRVNPNYRNYYWNPETGRYDYRYPNPEDL